MGDLDFEKGLEFVFAFLERGIFEIESQNKSGSFIVFGTFWLARFFSFLPRKTTSIYG